MWNNWRSYFKNFNWLAKYEWSLSLSKEERKRFVVKVVATFFVTMIIWTQIAKLDFPYHFIVDIIICWVILWCIFSFYRTWYLKIFAKRKLKQDWWWMLVKAKVVKIIEERHRDKDWDITVYFYLDVEDKEGHVYRSWDLWFWVYHYDPKANLEAVYKEYGYDFDENKKNVLLATIDNKIMELEFEKKEANLIKKAKLLYQLNVLKENKAIVERWYYLPNFEFKNWEKVQVGDEIDVYVDVLNKEYYYVDIDKYLKKTDSII